MPLLNPPDLLALGEICVSIVVALFAYWVRCRARFTYGIAEIVVSFFVLYVTFVPQKSFLLLNQGTSMLGKYLLTGIGVTTGIYIFVRGLDNIDQDLPTRWRRLWDLVFRGNAQR